MHLSSVKAALRRHQYRQEILKGSSAIRRVQYIDDQKVLVVQFVSGEQYAYADVPKAVWTRLIHAESAGQFFQANIRYKYQYRHMVDPTTTEFPDNLR